MQIAFADEQVSDFAAYWEARTMNVPVIRTTIAAPWGLTAQDPSAATTNGLVIYDCGAPAPPLGNIAPPKQACAMAGTEELHDLPAHVAAGRRQMKDFYQTGQIVNECAGGACTCATGACN